MRGYSVISHSSSRVGLRVGALFFCLLGLTGPVAANPQLANVQSEIKAQQQTIVLSKRELTKLNTQLKSDEQAVSAAAAKLEQTKQQLADNQQALTELLAEKQTLEKQAKQHQSLIAKQAVHAFQAGRHDYLKLLLNQQDPAKISRSLDYYDYLNKARIKTIQALRTTRDQLASNQQQIEQTEGQLTKLLAEQQADHKALLTSQQKRAQVRNTWLRTVQDDEYKLNQLIRTERELKQRLDVLRRERAAQERRELAEQERLAQREAEQARKVKETSTEQAKTASRPSKPARKKAGHYSGLAGVNLSWPVQGPVLISYGSQRSGQLKWKGTLIGAREGAQVKAAAPGQVVYAGWLDGFGMLLVLDHGRGYMSLYGHNQSLLRRVGQNVEQGEPIALVGDTGGQERPALYFEIRHQGEAINPARWLAR